MRSNRLYALWVLLIGGSFLFAAASATSSADEASVKAEPPAAAKVAAKSAVKAKIGEPAPDFKLMDTFGKAFTLAEFKGKIIVLEWLNQQCPVSRAAHTKSQMQKTYMKYAEKGVIWLGIDSSYFADPEKNRIYAAKMMINYPILHDADGKAGRTYEAKTTPHTYVIDKTGKLVYSGAIDDRADKNYVAAAVDDLLAGKPVAKPKTASYGCGIKYAKPK